MRIGELLVRAGHATQEHVDQALELQPLLHKRLGEILVDKKWVKPRDVAEALAAQYGYVNRVLPDNLDGDFYRQRKSQESTYLEEIDRRFRRVPRVRVRLLPRDVYGMDSLSRVSEQLLA